jgi:hypothetical protein
VDEELVSAAALLELPLADDDEDDDDDDDELEVVEAIDVVAVDVVAELCASGSSALPHATRAATTPTAKLRITAMLPAC